jgi:hypothetical protein
LAGGLLICSVLVALAVPTRAHAQFAGKASADVQFEENSNIFAIDTGYAQSAAYGARNSSTDLAYGAEFDATYTLSRQQLFATGSVKEYDYQELPDLNHDEFHVDTGLIWRIGELLDGKLDVARSRSMVPFLDQSAVTEALSLLTAQTETFQVGLQVNSAWRLEGSAYTTKSIQPTYGQPNLQLTQNSGTTSLQYGGFGPFTGGLTATYLTGNYSGSETLLDPPYNQSTAGFLASYKLSSTSFDGQITYSRRDFPGRSNEDASGLTGLLDFKDQLTSKTSITVKLDRLINTLYLNLGSETDTDAGFSVNWQATYKVDVTLGYTFTYRAFPGQVEVDYQQFTTLAINYQPRRWLRIGPYANIQTRSSNIIGRNFNATVYGISITASTPDEGK